MKKILIIFSCIALIILGVKVRQWVLYINQLNQEEQIKYELAINEKIGNANGSKEFFYNVYSRLANYDYTISYVVNSNTYEYTKKVYDYFDLGLLFGDLSCVNYEVHFFDIATKEEQIFNYRPYEMSRIDTSGVYDCEERARFYVENGEYKVFFSYAPTYDSLGRDYRSYGSFIYNFTTGEYENFYESNNIYDEEFIRMFEECPSLIPNWNSNPIFKLLRNRDFCNSNEIARAIGTIYLGNEQMIIRLSGCDLPQHNRKLYDLYPEIEQYRETDTCRNEIILSFPMDMNPEELAKMFMEDGKEITYEGVCVAAEDSIDGLEHEVSSYEEYIHYLDVDEKNDIDMTIYIFGYPAVKYSSGN